MKLGRVVFYFGFFSGKNREIIYPDCVIVPTFKENRIFILGVFVYSVNFCRLK